MTFLSRAYSLVLLGIFVSLIYFNAGMAAEDLLTGQATIIDGNSVILNKQRIFFDGADAPELKQRCKMPKGRIKCGTIAKKFLEKKIAGRPVQCRIKAKDPIFNRLVGLCMAGGEDLARVMIEAGWAVAYGGGAGRYRVEARTAREQQKGIWAGSFTLPAAWRRSFTFQEHTFNGQGVCAIKGNIDADGTKRYYLPYQRAYDRTRIDSSKNERWFCSKAEANKAGWKPARN